MTLGLKLARRWSRFIQCSYLFSLFINRRGSAVAQWLSAWLETEGSRVRVSPASLPCGPWARHIYSSLVLVQPRKTRPCLTERLLMGRKESNLIVRRWIWPQAQWRPRRKTFLGGFVPVACLWLGPLWLILRFSLAPNICESRTRFFVSSNTVLIWLNCSLWRCYT